MKNGFQFRGFQHLGFQNSRASVSLVGADVCMTVRAAMADVETGAARCGMMAHTASVQLTVRAEVC